MKELKSKKTDKITVYTEEEYALIVRYKPEWLRKFEIKDLKPKPLTPQLKTEVPAELKAKTKTQK